MEMTLPEPEVAFLFDPHTLYTKHRTTFSQRMWDLKRFGELLDRDNVSFTRLQGEMDPDTLKGVKLLVTNALDEVMSGNNIALIKKAVQEDGMRLVMTANTGKYSPEHQNEEFVLLRALGITPPTGPLSYGWIASDLNPAGVVGNAAAATAEKGRATAEHQVAGLIGLLRDVAAHPLTGFAPVPG